MTLFKEGDSTAEARMAILVEQREALISRIEEMQSTLSRLDRKIEMYKGMCSPGCCGKK